MSILFYLGCFAGGLCAKLHNRSQCGHDALLSHLHFNTGHKPTQVLGQGLARKSISEFIHNFMVKFKQA